MRYNNIIKLDKIDTSNENKTHVKINNIDTKVNLSRENKLHTKSVNPNNIITYDNIDVVRAKNSDKNIHADKYTGNKKDEYYSRSGNKSFNQKQ